jgi:hypothetical protein
MRESHEPMDDIEAPPRLSPESESELGTMPDISVPRDWLLWRSEWRAELLIELPPMESRFAENMVEQLAPGLAGRGFSAITPDGNLLVSYGVTEKEAENGDSSDILVGYGALLVRHFGLPYESVIDHVIGKYIYDPNALDETDRMIRQIGLRAVTKLSKDN